MTRKKSNLKLNRKKVSRFERKQKSLLQNETKNKTNIERSNGSQNQQRKQVTRVFSQRNTPRKKYLTFKRNSPRGKYSPFFSPNKKRVKLSSPSPRKLCSIKPNFVGLENKGHIEESDHSYHLLYKKALSRKALFVTSYPNPSDSLGNQYEDGISVLPEFEDIEVYCGDHFCVSQDSSETDKHDQQHFLSCITNRETSSKINDSTDRKPDNHVYSDHNYYAQYETTDMQVIHTEEQFNSSHSESSGYDTAQTVKNQTHSSSRETAQGGAYNEDSELLSEINDLLPTVLQEFRNSGVNPLLLKQFFGQVCSKVFPFLA